MGTRARRHAALGYEGNQKEMNKTLWEICRDCVGLWLFDWAITIMTREQLKEITNEIIEIFHANRIEIP